MTHMEPDPTFHELDEWFEYIRQEIADMHHSRRIYKETIMIIHDNPNLQSASQLFVDWFARNYVAMILLRVRRLVDEDARTKSFIRFLTTLKKRPETIPHERWRAVHLGMVCRASDLDLEFSDSAQEVPDPEITLQHDIEGLRKEAAQIKEYVDQRIAHYDLNPAVTVASFQETELAQELPRLFGHLERLLQKYFLLFHDGPLVFALPVIEFDWKDIFYQPWIVKQSETACANGTPNRK